MTDDDPYTYEDWEPPAWAVSERTRVGACDAIRDQLKATVALLERSRRDGEWALDQNKRLTQDLARRQSEIQCLHANLDNERERRAEEFGLSAIVTVAGEAFCYRDRDVALIRYGVEAQDGSSRVWLYERDDIQWAD